MSGSAAWPRVKLGDVLRHVARPLTVEVDGSYREIGIRSHGKGLFHKAPVTGAALGDKRVFHVEPGDFVLNIVFAWEGAIGLVSEAERGMIASHRFPCFRAVDGRVDLRFLERYFQTPAGLELLGRVSPGGAGRNRTLNRTAFMQQEIALPSLAEQQRIVGKVNDFEHHLSRARSLRNESDELISTLKQRLLARLADAPQWPRLELGDLIAEPPRNGLGPKPEADSGSGGQTMLRISAVSSAEDRFVDFRAAKAVELTSAEAQPFIVRDGDVFMVRYNGDIDRVAKAAVARNVPTTRPVFPDKLIRLRPKSEVIDPDFLVIALSTPSVRTQVEAMGRTTAGNIGINGIQVRSLAIPVPPLDEQRKVVGALDALQAEFCALRAVQANTSTELDALLPAILDRAFAGAL